VPSTCHASTNGHPRRAILSLLSQARFYVTTHTGTATHSYLSRQGTFDAGTNESDRPVLDHSVQGAKREMHWFVLCGREAHVDDLLAAVSTAVTRAEQAAARLLTDVPGELLATTGGQSNTTPIDTTNANIPTSPVSVLGLAFLLPTFVLVGIWLAQGWMWSYARAGPLLMIQ
jgi:hypothetical protein